MVRRLVAVLSLSLGLTAWLTTDSQARWSTEPTPLLMTSESLPQVAAASDAADGAIVAFEVQDSTDASLHLLRALHLRSDGSLDPAWPAGGALLSSFTGVERGALGAVEDRSGGAFVWWLEGTSIYLTHVAPGGEVSPAWPARGRLLGVMASVWNRPQAFSDGAGGIYIGWLSGTWEHAMGRVMRLGPANTGSGGWPNSPRLYAMSSAPDPGYTCQFALSRTREGGLCLAWGTTPFVDGAWIPGTWWATRLRPSGSVTPGWPFAGVPVGPLASAEFWQDGPSPPVDRRVGVAEAEDGGLLVLTDEYAPESNWKPVLHKLGADANTAPGWPAAGIPFDVGGWYLHRNQGEASSFTLLADSAGTAYATFTIGAIDAPAQRALFRCSSAGGNTFLAGMNPPDVEQFLSPGGLLYTAEFTEHGPTGPASPWAHYAARVTFPDGSGAVLAHEMDWRRAILWCGDVALAPTSGEGAIFVWSQYTGRHGLFARRFTMAGEVTAAPDMPVLPRTLRLRFVPARGVVVDGALVPGSRLALHDIGGRRVLGALVPAGGGAPFVLPGSDALSPGVYFVRATLRDGTNATAKVVVWR